MAKERSAGKAHLPRWRGLFMGCFEDLIELRETMERRIKEKRREHQAAKDSSFSRIRAGKGLTGSSDGSQVCV
jgi:hypothetical protein